MPFPSIGVTFDSAEACVGDCCDPSPLCPPRLGELDVANLNVSITCDPTCQTDCFGDTPTLLLACWPDTGTMPWNSGLVWEFSGLTCNCGGTRFECVDGNMSITFSTSCCLPITVPTTLIFVQNSPFMAIFTMSSHYWGYCGYDVGLGECGAEYEITITITE